MGGKDPPSPFQSMAGEDVNQPAQDRDWLACKCCPGAFRNPAGNVKGRRKEIRPLALWGTGSLGSPVTAGEAGHDRVGLRLLMPGAPMAWVEGRHGQGEWYMHAQL